MCCLFHVSYQSDREAVVVDEVVHAEAFVHALVAGIEVEVPRVVRVALVERRRPVVAVAADTVETRTVAEASGGQYHSFAIHVVWKNDKCVVVIVTTMCIN